MNNEYGQGNNTLKYALPVVADPLDYICVVVQVPNDIGHIKAFRGAIYDLSRWWNWQRDDAHTARVAGYRWLHVWRALRTVNCNDIGPCPSAGLLEDQEVPIRVDCDCHAFITCCDGTEKQLVTTDMIGKSSQPGSGSPQPAPGGGQQAYDGCLDVRKAWLIPFPLSSGDTVSLEGASGAWNDPDADLFIWRVQDGNEYFAGAEVPGTTRTVSTDPLNTVPHMAFVININGTFYDFSGGSFTVPSGISLANATIQANDSDVTDDNGEICFTINVVNNQTATWSHEFDFTTSNGGWFRGRIFGIPEQGGTWSAGQGWLSDYISGIGDDLDIETAIFPSTIITSVEVLYETTGPIGAAFRGVVYDPGASTYGSLETGVGTFDTVLTGPQAMTQLGVMLDSGPGSSTPSKITKIIVKGQGTDPF